MEAMLLTALVLLLSCSAEVTPFAAAWTINTPTIQHITPGDSVKLQCDKNHRNKTMWYGQKQSRSPFIIISAEMNSSNQPPSVKFFWGYNSRMNVTWNPTNNSMILTIKNVHESDEGFYFCTIGEGIFTTPGTGHILIVDEKRQTISSTPATTTGQMSSSGSSLQCGTDWTMVTILCPISIILTALVILIIQKIRGRIRGPSQTELQIRPEKQEEEDGVQYSALRFEKRK